MTEVRLVDDPKLTEVRQRKLKYQSERMSTAHRMLLELNQGSQRPRDIERAELLDKCSKRMGNTRQIVEQRKEIPMIWARLEQYSKPPNLSEDSGFQIPATGRVDPPKAPVHPGSKSSENSFVVPTAGDIRNPKKQSNQSSIQNSSSIKASSKESVNIPQVNPLGGSLNALEEQILEGEGLQSLGAYKQFNQLDLLVNGKFQTKDVFQAFSFLICQFLHLSEQGQMKLIDIKDKSIGMEFDSKVYQQQWSILRTHGGDDISDNQIKRLFIQYVIRIFENEKSIEILQNYYVLADILTMIIREYIRVNIGSSDGEIFEKAIKTKSADEIYPFYQSLDLKYQKRGSQHVFSKQQKRLVIEEIESRRYRSWIE